MQLAHGDQVCDQTRRQLSLVERGFPDLWWHVDVVNGAAQSAAELLRVWMAMAVCAVEPTLPAAPVTRMGSWDMIFFLCDSI
jgi:hypothetical protein